MSREAFIEQIKEQTWVRNQNPEIPELLIYQYTDWSNANDPYLIRQQYMDINTDAVFKAPALQSADAFIRKGVPTYTYQLEAAPRFFYSFPIPGWSGIYHGADLSYTFGFPFLTHKNYTTDDDKKLTRDVMTLWSNFAKTG